MTDSTTLSTPTAGGRSSWAREPRQARAHDSLTRALDAAAELLGEEGYEGFSVAEVCRRASVSTGSLYGRFSSKEELFLAVHERELARTLAQAQTLFRDSPAWQRLSTRDLITTAVRTLSRHYAEHGRLLRVFILRAAADQRVLVQGNKANRVIEAAFVNLLLTRANELPQPDPQAAVRTAYRLAADTVTWRIAFGTEFTGPIRKSRPRAYDRWADQVGAACRTLLLTPPA